MARKRRSDGSGWLIAGALVLAAVVAWWWFGARRAEAPSPPGTVPGSRVIGEPPAHHEDISNRDKQELERVLRERAPGAGE
jgi:hypothetical protein